MAPRVLVTGANGFVGRVVCRAIADAGWTVRPVVRSANAPLEGPGPDPTVRVDGIHGRTDWGGALRGVDAVVHLAARVHVIGEQGEAALRVYREINTAGTLRLADAAVTAGVRRFVYVSTIKVNGEATEHGSFTSDDDPAPSGPYAVSKYEAELGLRALFQEGSIETVVLRPPLVYGPGVRANFLRLLKLADSPLPLPLGAVTARRDLLSVGNLAGAIASAVCSPIAAGRTLLLSDGDPMTTGELVRRIRMLMGRPARLVRVPPAVLRATAAAVGLSEHLKRLVDPLEVDIAETLRCLEWRPAPSAGALAETVRWFRGAG